MEKGIVTKTELKRRGFVFIVTDDNISYFAHAKEFVPLVSFDYVQEGQSVTFEPFVDNKVGKGNQLRAREVRLVD